MARRQWPALNLQAFWRVYLMMSKSNASVRRGFTLIELVAVVAIIAVLAVFVAGRFERINHVARITVAESDLKTIRDAFMDPDTGYVADMSGIPGFSVGYLRLGNLLVSTNLYGAVADGVERTRGMRVDDLTDEAARSYGCADGSAFTSWNEERGRGWRGPYVRTGSSSVTASFPGERDIRYDDDTTFGDRGFYPDVANIELPDDIVMGLNNCSAYGFPGEPTITDPWGNPYVLQIPPVQAFWGVTNISDELRFQYARVVSAGPNGILETPCYSQNVTNRLGTTWNERTRRLIRQAGLIDGDDRSTRGDDLVMFLTRGDVDEGEDRW